MDKLSDRFMYYCGLLAPHGVSVDDLKHIQNLIDKQEQGLLIELPCKVGDIVYILKFEGVWRIIPHQVKTLGYVLQLIENEAIDDFVFLTRSEAEEALAKMGGK